MSNEFPHDSPLPPSEPWLAGGNEPELLTPAGVSPSWREWKVPALLFFLTFLSTTYAGIFYVVGADVGFLRLMFEMVRHPSLFLLGLPFSYTLIAILLAHEMGHYLACRHYGIRCTPPYFLPFPISFAGTMGAFIRIKSHFPTKRALFDVGIAGPLAGFAFAFPALVIGIAKSELHPRGLLHGNLAFGEPLLFRWIGKLVVGYSPELHDMVANPIAMAAWFGLLVTSLNLLPIWQLDGGHISYALLGRDRQKAVSIAAAVFLILTSFAGWPIPSYLVFALLVLFFGMRSRFYHPPICFDHQELGAAREILGIVAYGILIVCFTPVPIYIA